MKLEEFFYKSFRNICRNKLADYKNVEVLKSIKQHIENPNLYYHLKLSYVIALLQDLLSPFVDFSLELDMNGYKMLSDTHKLHCNENTADQTFCSMDNNIVKLLIPNKNLVNGEQTEFPNNETFYYTKLADELIRNKNVRIEVLDGLVPKSINKGKYTPINQNEIILLEEDLEDELLLNKLYKHTKKSNVRQVNEVPIDTIDYTTPDTNLIDIDEEIIQKANIAFLSDDKDSKGPITI